MIDKFQSAAEAVGATVKRFIHAAEGAEYVRALAPGEPITASHLPDNVRRCFSELSQSPARSPDAGLCVSFAHGGIAATGSLLLDLSDQAGRARTALPLIHAVFLRASSIAPDLRSVRTIIADALALPSPVYLSITTGPSRTADIERVLTIGVHGPKELHILIIEGE